MNEKKNLFIEMIMHDYQLSIQALSIYIYFKMKNESLFYFYFTYKLHSYYEICLRYNYLVIKVQSN